MLVTMSEMKALICQEFKRQYGFAPSKKAIVPLESGGAGNKVDWLAFHVGGKGYTFDVCRRFELVRDEVYDLK